MYCVVRTEIPEGRLVWRTYKNPLALLTAARAAEVPALIAEVESLAEQGRYCVGFVCYEAAPAFDSALVCHEPRGPMPLAQFAVFDRFEESLELPDWEGCKAPDWQQDVDRETYERNVGQVLGLIEAGETYQVNYTVRLTAEGGGNPFALFRAMAHCRRTEYSAFLATDRFAVCSVSPELFFHLDGDLIVTKPMKGTAPRGRTSLEDEELAKRLVCSEKETAENVMIVDMARNDLGKISIVGSVQTSELFAVVRYATTHQMTSTVRARTNATLLDVFQALFPAASVTGAPKARAMQIIKEIETGPRGVYTGCIGVVGPGRHARFSVAIRTATLDRGSMKWEYGVGGGIVWDSTPEGEYEECLLKAMAASPAEPFQLLETLRWTPEVGYALLGRHLDRLRGSADYFQFQFDQVAVSKTLLEAADRFDQSPRSVRLLHSASGALHIEDSPLPCWPEGRLVRLGIAPSPVDEHDRFLFHKTTQRGVYEGAWGGNEDCDEVLLWNQRGFVTECTFSNVACEIGGRLYTPPVSDGLLPGTLRAEMLTAGELAERSLTLDEVRRADRLFVLNSVRGISRAEISGSNERAAIDEKTLDRSPAVVQ